MHKWSKLLDSSWIASFVITFSMDGTKQRMKKQITLVFLLLHERKRKVLSQSKWNSNCLRQTEIDDFRTCKNTADQQVTPSKCKIISAWCFCLLRIFAYFPRLSSPCSRQWGTTPHCPFRLKQPLHNGQGRKCASGELIQGSWHRHKVSKLLKTKLYSQGTLSIGLELSKVPLGITETYCLVCNISIRGLLPIHKLVTRA